MDARLKAFPKEFTDHLQKNHPPGVLPSVLRSYLEPRTTTLRVNALRATRDDVTKELSRAGFLFECDRTIPQCVYLKKFSRKRLESLESYQQGWFYLQNASCQLPPHILNPQPHERVLDLCASPGGKTSHLAALMKNEGQIVALEPDYIRFERLKHNLLLLGVTNALCVRQRGEVYCKNLLASGEPLFDCVLVDAPCSGDGTFTVNDRASFSHWSLPFVEDVAKKQRRLLDAAITVTKKKGRVLYTTCSTSLEENELVVASVLLQHKNVRLIDISLFNNVLVMPSAIIMSRNKSFIDFGVSKCRRIYPSPRFEGFFFALFHIN
jgi:16S rRNA (cytosine1407-C5)-methyltransferase